MSYRGHPWPLNVASPFPPAPIFGAIVDLKFPTNVLRKITIQKYLAAIFGTRYRQNSYCDWVGDPPADFRYCVGDAKEETFLRKHSACHLTWKLVYVDRGGLLYLLGAAELLVSTFVQIQKFTKPVSCGGRQARAAKIDEMSPESFEMQSNANRTTYSSADLRIAPRQGHSATGRQEPQEF